MTIQKTFVYLLAVLLLSSGIVFAQTQTVTALPNPGITPESSFYFLDKFGEALREFFTFNPEGRARLQIKFAAERVAEIKIILETKGVEARGLGVAQSRLLAHLADATTIVSEQKAEGEDVRALAKELDEKFEGPKTALEEAFRAKKRALKVQEDELKEKLKEARRIGDVTEAESFAKQLGEVKAELALLEQEEEDQEEDFEDEEERIEEEMEDKTEAEKKIQKAEREKQKITEEAAEEGISLPPETLIAFDRHIAEAKLAFDAGKFEEAKHHAKEAKKSLDAVGDAIDDLKEVREEEEELKEEQEEQKEKGREAGEEDEELKKENRDGEVERLDKEMEKVGEEIKKAEERLREIGGEDEDEDDK